MVSLDTSVLPNKSVQKEQNIEVQTSDTIVHAPDTVGQNSDTKVHAPEIIVLPSSDTGEQGNALEIRH